MSSPLGCDAA